MVESSPKAILELAKEIAEGLKAIHALNEDMVSQLRALGASFRDEGYNEVVSYVSKSKAGIENAMPDLQTVISNLTEYAEYLRQARREL